AYRYGHVLRREVPHQDGHRVTERARVGDRGAGGDGRRVVAHHVREDEGPETGGPGRLAREPAALHARAVLAHDVHPGDVYAAREEPRAEGLLVGQREPRGRRAGAPRRRARGSARRAAPARRPRGLPRGRRAHRRAARPSSPARLWTAAPGAPYKGPRMATTESEPRAGIEAFPALWQRVV